MAMVVEPLPKRFLHNCHFERDASLRVRMRRQASNFARSEASALSSKYLCIPPVARSEASALYSRCPCLTKKCHVVQRSPNFREIALYGVKRKSLFRFAL